MRLIAFAASLRAGSWNRKLIQVIADAARGQGAEVDLAEFHEFEVPLYNADVKARGMPPGAEEFRRRLEAASGMLISSPEYNYSLPGTLKNLIDWASRYEPMPFRGKSALLASTSTGMFGGVRGLWQLRIPLEGCGVFVYPDMFPLRQAAEAFTPSGDLADTATRERLERLLARYLKAATALAPE